MIKCPTCASGVRYDIEKGMVYCEHCSNYYDPYIFDSMEKDAVMKDEGKKDGKVDGLYETAVWVCPGCGAEITTTDSNDITSVCAYCGNDRIIFDRIKSKRRPTSIIPFSVTKEDCKERYRKAAKRSFLSPSYLKKPELVDSFRGIYMPYWKYSYRLKGEISIPYREPCPAYRDGDYLLYDFDKLTAKIQGEFSKESHDASLQFDDGISEALAPYREEDEKDFSPGFLCGFYAETDNVDAGEYRAEVEDRTRNSILKSARGYAERKFNEAEADIPLSDVKYKRSMFPVWFMSHRGRRKMTYATVNGSSGKVVADFPVSKIRFFLFSAVLFGLFFFLMNLSGVLIRPLIGLIINAVISSAALFFTVYEFEKYSQWKGSVWKRKNTKQVAKPKKSFRMFMTSGCLGPFLVIILPIIISSFMLSLIDSGTLSNEGVYILFYVCFAAAICVYGIKKTVSSGLSKRASGVISIILLLLIHVFSFSVMVSRPLNDVYYYAGIVNAAIFVIQFIIAMHIHDMRSYRRPPQFNKKGGDNNA